MRRLIPLLILAVALPALAGCSNSEAPDAAPSSGAGNEQPAETEAPPTGVGSSATPAPAGTAGTLTDWTVSIGATNPEASALLAATDPHNPPPTEGRSYVLAPVTATYIGAGSNTAWKALHIQFVGNTGKGYGVGAENFCGVLPTPLSDGGVLNPNETSTGNVCAKVPTVEIDGGTWSVENLEAADQVKVFFALQ